MAIYPIIPGQKPSERNVIPPHAPTEHPTSASKPATEKASNDLIDFGPSEGSAPAAAPVPAENPAVAAAAQNHSSNSSTEIRQLLANTGQKAPDGPLIDFTTDMKHDLPKTQPAQAPLKRSETEESNDQFFDAES